MSTRVKKKTNTMLMVEQLLDQPLESELFYRYKGMGQSYQTIANELTEKGINISHQTVKNWLVFFKIAKPSELAQLKDLNKIDKTMLAYMAGVFDSHNPFYCKQTNPTSFTVQISITKRQESFLPTLQEVLGAGILGYNQGLEAYVYQIKTYDEVSNVLRAVIPYLQVRRQEAEILLAFIDSRMERLASAEGRCPFDEYELGLYKEFRKLKR